MNLNDMKKILHFVMFWLCTLQMFAQENSYQTVDYSMIEKVISDKNSEYYYPEMKKRFLALDTTLTEKHLFHLYYGTIIQKSFDVFETTELSDEVVRIIDKEDISKEEWRLLVSEFEQVIAKNLFFDFNLYDYLIYGCVEIGEKEKSEKYNDLFLKLLSAILSTGDGETMDTAIDVIQISNEFYFLTALGVEFLDSELISNDKAQKIELLRFKIDEKNEDTQDFPKGMYFDVTKIFELYNELLFKEVNFDE